MSDKKQAKHVAAHEVNQTAKSVKKENRESRQKTTADRVVKYIFIGLIALAVIYMIWSMTVVE